MQQWSPFKALEGGCAQTECACIFWWHSFPWEFGLFLNKHRFLCTGTNPELSFYLGLPAPETFQKPYMSMHCDCSSAPTPPCPSPAAHPNTSCQNDPQIKPWSFPQVCCVLFPSWTVTTLTVFLKGQSKQKSSHCFSCSSEWKSVKFPHWITSRVNILPVLKIYITFCYEINAHRLCKIWGVERVKINCYPTNGREIFADFFFFFF